MIVQALQRHRALNEVRQVGVLYHINPQQGRHLASRGLVRMVASNEDWYSPMGRELRTEPLTDVRWPTVVACLNIWNDRPALEQTLPTWINRVDALVVADGPYKGVATGAQSTDGLDEFLALLARPVRAVPVPGKRAWTDQNVKRTALLQAAVEAFPGALLFVIDADEYVAADIDLHAVPQGDTGWVTVVSTTYKRPYGQPRFFRAQPGLNYRGRHHWLYVGERLLASHQYAGPDFEHRCVPVFLRNQRGLGHTAERTRAKQVMHEEQAKTEAPTLLTGRPSDQIVGARESLRIASVTTYDPGMVAFRLHTAINTTTPHASVLLRRGFDNPFAAPRQYDVDQAPATSFQFLRDADVVHCHLDYSVLRSLGVKPKRLVIHHHGTMLRLHIQSFATLDKHAVLRLASNLELLSYGENLRWLPNPVSVARLRRVREGWRPSTTFRVSHSPSKRQFKGTAEFLAVCEALQAKGVPIEPVLIEGKSHTEALRLKATCDACFDSFWLGLQCSGVEAAAMGMPVIAGDSQVAERYTDLLGRVPYIFANDEAGLAAVLERLVMDEAWRTQEAAAVSKYVEEYHDDAAVALRYLDLLDEAIHWRERNTLKKDVA